MIVNQIKSILRNKANIIYIVIMVVLFVALNISINIQTIIDVFFDVQMNNYTEKMKVEQIKEVKIEIEKSEEKKDKLVIYKQIKIEKKDYQVIIETIASKSRNRKKKKKSI